MLCLCSILTPIEKFFFSIFTPFSYNFSNVDLALCPIVSILLPHITAVTFEFSNSKSVTFSLNKNSPPSFIISFRIFRMMFIKLSVPICGLFIYKICSGAPKL